MRAERITWRPDQRREQQMLIGQRYELLPAGRVRESVEHTFAAHRTRDAFLAQPLRARAGPSPHPQLMARLNLLLRSRYAATCCARIRATTPRRPCVIKPARSMAATYSISCSVRDRDVRHSEALARVHLRHGGPGRIRCRLRRHLAVRRADSRAWREPVLSVGRQRMAGGASSLINSSRLLAQPAAAARHGAQ
ncbi:hypothetical protein OKW33_001287 [Paraburkholderia atlantica]